MTNFDTLIKHNKDFAAHEAAADLLMPSLPEALPHVKALIVGCADMRVDPAQLLGIKLGEAVVMRNIGGRITPGTLQMLGLLGKIGQVSQAIPGGGGEFHLIVLQHTDCGITRLVASPEMLSPYFEISKDELKTKEIANPWKAVAGDVATLRSIPDLPAEWLVSGLVYDVATGLIEVVVPPAPLRNTQVAV